MRTAGGSLLLRMLNASGGALQTVRPPAQLDAASLLAESRSRTGLTDFGAEDGSFVEGLHAFVDSAETEGDLTPVGRVALHVELVRLLRNRLEIQEVLRRNPSIREAEIRAPIVVTGLPRSGTTLLHRLLALSPETRAPLTWELFEPQPHGERARIRRTRLRLALSRRMDAGLMAVHPIEAESPEECALLLEHSFQTAQFHSRAFVPSYMAWLLRRDLRPSYRLHRTLLQLLQHGHPPSTWVLKAPVHLFALDALLDTYPDARIVQVHRDLGHVAPSGCSLDAVTRGLVSRVDRSRLGERWMETWSTAIDRAIRVRDADRSDRFCDVRYVDLVRDPVGTITAVRERFGEKTFPALEEAIASYIAARPAGRYGRHRYAMADFGLDTRQLRRRFNHYAERFGVPIDA